MTWLGTLTLTDTPAIYHANTPRIASTVDGPYIRASFRPLQPLDGGRWDATHSQKRMALLLVLDLFWPDGQSGETPTSLYTPAAAAELDNELQYLTLSFQDYSTPSSPVTVSDAFIKVTRQVSIQNMTPQRPYLRWQVRAQPEWVGRVEDSFA